MKRSDKIALLAGLIDGKPNKTALSKLKRQAEGFTFCVCNGEVALTDLVDTRLADSEGRMRVTYGEFLKNPDVYGRQCITVD